MTQKSTTLWSFFVGSFVVGILISFAPNASAASINWYAYKSPNEDCWQAGGLGAEAFGCDAVGAGYLNVPGGLSGGLAHMDNFPGYPGGEDFQLNASADYCNYYKLGDSLTRQDATNQGPFTGWTPPTPYSSYQETDVNENACQANWSTWGYEVRNDAPGNTCYSVCGMHHYVSFHNQELNDRPWGKPMGQPSLVISVEAELSTFTYWAEGGKYDVGDWGFTCPQFEDATTGDIIEYCLEQWQSTRNEAPKEGAAECNSWGGHFYDEIKTFAVPPPAALDSTERAGSANTEIVDTTGGWKHYEVAITTTNLENAINQIKATCPPTNPSTHPQDWALIGIEQGIEGWRDFSVMAGASNNLSLRTEYTPAPPEVTTEGFINESNNSTELKGKVNPNGSATEVHFDYGPTASYGQSTGVIPIGSGIAPQGFVQSAPTTSNTLYHYRIVASNTGGTTYGEDHTFTSAGPGVETNEASELTETSAIIAGKFNPRGIKTQYSFELGTTTSYGTTISGGGVEYGGEGWNTVTAHTGELVPGTTYHFRIKAFDLNNNVSYGADHTFTTVNHCGGVNITGQGSTLLNRAQQVWESGFNTSADAHACNGTQGSKGTPHIGYTVTDSGAGLISWGVEGGSPSFGATNAFIGTDEPPSAAQLAEIEAHETTLVTHAVETVPVVQAALAIVVHLPANCVATSEAAAGRLALNNSTLEGIFRGTITKWSQLTEDGDKLTGTGCNSASSITKVVRHDRSGTTHIVKKYLALINSASFEREDKQTSTWAATAEGSTNAMWPKAAEVIRPTGNGDEELLKLVAQTPGSIGYANLADARANTTFVPPTGGASTATFWTVIQNKTGTVTYADPASNKDVAAVGEANCSKEEYSNGEHGFPPESVTAPWNTVTTNPEEIKYTLCGLSYILTFDRYSAFPGTTIGETTTGNNFVRFVLDSAKEAEGNGNNGGQTLIKKHDYYELSSAIWKLAVKGGEAVKY